VWSLVLCTRQPIFGVFSAAALVLLVFNTNSVIVTPISGSFAEKDLQLKGSYACSPRCSNVTSIVQNTVTLWHLVSGCSCPPGVEYYGTTPEGLL